MNAMAVKKKEVAPKSADERKEIIRSAVESKQGLKIYIGVIGGKRINAPQNLQGELTHYVEKPDMIGFQIRQSGGILRSYRTATLETMLAFLKWINEIDINRNTEMFPGDAARFDCPVG